MDDALTAPVLVDVRSPEVGTFHPAAELWATSDGGHTTPVKIGQVVGQIEALGLRHDVLASAGGWLARGDAQPGFPVEYGQVLFRIIQLPPEVAASVGADEPIELQLKEVADDDSHDYIIQAPIIGVFYASPSPDAEPYVQVGQDVIPGQPVCLIEAMKMFNEITSDAHGRVTKILVANGATVEAGQGLIALSTDTAEERLLALSKQQ
ncbi:MAG: hypothetical protein HY092_01305 [Candidatus Kerfeldbacteria bacterium]|nr:hypothetical protein [Candidatus Kerfeldbacteria bacterium]